MLAHRPDIAIFDMLFDHVNVPRSQVASIIKDIDPEGVQGMFPMDQTFADMYIVGVNSVPLFKWTVFPARRAEYFQNRKGNGMVFLRS